jgi:hypothetical protein
MWASCGRWCAWCACCAGGRCPRLRWSDNVEVGQRLVRLVRVRPGWRVMLAERKAARSVVSFWALEALHRRIPGLMVADW